MQFSINKLKNTVSLFIALLLMNGNLSAQFIKAGQIEFEVKTNLRKTMGSSTWAEAMKEKLPKFKVAYYRFDFNNQESVYKFDRWENKEAINEMFRQSDERAVWYTNHSQKQVDMRKDVFGTSFQVMDSLPAIEWKLTNENRVIAGYNCRKAVGRIMDSVYVFAFYTDEIIIPGGPCSINGLPGMVLGMTIPRLYGSWMATKVTPMANVVLTRPEPAKKSFDRKSAKTTIVEKTKGWTDDSDPESGKWIQLMLWNVLI
jgi:GLPGLI family protein